MRRSDVAQVERRILSHHYDIDVMAEIELHGIAECVMIAGDGLDSNRMRMSLKPPAFPRQRADVVMIKRIAALLRLQHQGETRIAANVERWHRVHLESSAQGHVAPFVSHARH